MAASARCFGTGMALPSGALPVRNVEPLTFEYVKPSQRSYK
jgi:hypothetical protein